MSSDRLADARWFKSTRSLEERECVEVAFLGDGEIATRDSKVGGTEQVLLFGTRQWDAFVRNLNA
ncbi:DUF397 domain-containing protein [Actinokineospora iranica]|uniref:DUF397 domain-containing protein n=1 Tax=Actinokineospora iranica TaxID=1271860 RepID=A0A1G6PBT1_9PSEU|nr:DUF397 domain-containing protein [Actinokineospora iranica]SDC77024.1 protein of unknown function [Actinokineospora iranica]